MGKLSDPEESIKQLYEEDIRQVPYPVFMRCFDKLLADPPSPEPAPPSDELEKSFRAVCMALDLGIDDRQERGEDRKEEFHEHILPAWKKHLSEARFEAYQEILSGKVRKRMERLRRQEQKRKAEEHQQREEEMRSAAARERQSRFARAMQDAVSEAERQEEAEADLRAAAEGGEAGGEESPPAETKKEEEPAWTKENGKPIARTAEVLCQSLASGDMPIKYNPPKKRAPLAYYRLQDHEVGVEFIDKNGQFFVVIRLDSSLRQAPDIKDVAASVAEDLGYEKVNAFAFQKTENGRDGKMQLGKKGTYILRRQSEEFTPEEVAEIVFQMHKELIQLLCDLQRRSSS